MPSGSRRSRSARRPASPACIVTVARPPIIAPTEDGLDLVVAVEVAPDELEDGDTAIEHDGETYRIWREVDNFTYLGADRYVYLVDRMAGSIMFAPAARSNDDDAVLADERDVALARRPEGARRHAAARARHPRVVPARRRRRGQRRRGHADDDQGGGPGDGHQSGTGGRRPGGRDARQRPHPRPAGAAHPQPGRHRARLPARGGAGVGRGRPGEGRHPGRAVAVRHPGHGRAVPRPEPARRRRSDDGHRGAADGHPDPGRPRLGPVRARCAPIARDDPAGRLGPLQDGPRPGRDRRPSRGGPGRGPEPGRPAPARDGQPAADGAQRRWLPVRPVAVRLEHLQDHPVRAGRALRPRRPAGGRRRPERGGPGARRRSVPAADLVRGQRPGPVPDAQRRRRLGGDDQLRRARPSSASGRIPSGRAWSRSRRSSPTRRRASRCRATAARPG